MTTQKPKQQASLGELQQVASSLAAQEEELAVFLPPAWDGAKLYQKDWVSATRAFLPAETVARLESENDSAELQAARKRLAGFEAMGQKLYQGNFADNRDEIVRIATECNRVREEIAELTNIDGIIAHAVEKAMLIEAPDPTQGDLVEFRQNVSVVKQKWPASDGGLILFALDEQRAKNFELPANLVGQIALAIRLPSANGKARLQIVGHLPPHGEPSTFFKDVNKWLTGEEGTNGTNSTSAFKQEIGAVSVAE